MAIRRTAKSQHSEKLETDTGLPGDLVGPATDREFWRTEDPQHGECGRCQLGQPLGNTGANRPMTIFIPPAVFDEEDAVLNLPMSSRSTKQLGCLHQAGI